MLRYNVVALSPDCRVGLNIEPDHKMTVLPFLHIITLVSFVFKLHGCVMLSESGHFDDFFNTLFSKSCAATGFARIDNEVTMAGTSVTL